MSRISAGLRVVFPLAQSPGARSRVEALKMLLDRGYAVSAVASAPASEHGSPANTGHHVRGEAVLIPADALTGDANTIVEAVDTLRQSHERQPIGAWKPWFPVIDYQRCTNCMQCLSFCLFDVYGVSAENKIQVQNQSNCKTECPACSRVCPEVAIMFPKYRHSPINGDEVHVEDVRREAMKVDISALLGGDVYAALRDRSAKAKSRFSKERDEARALKERQTCLVKLQEAFDVPPEVLAALPSADEIREKAEAARRRATAARAETGS